MEACPSLLQGHFVFLAIIVFMGFTSISFLVFGPALQEHSSIYLAFKSNLNLFLFSDTCALAVVPARLVSLLERSVVA